VKVKFLIAGSNGQLAREFTRVLGAGMHEVIAPSEERLDISEPNSIHGAISEKKPKVIINCAAYNLADRAEEDFDAAYSVNAIGGEKPGNRQQKTQGLAGSLHYGLCVVFDGSKEDFYTEEDKPNPVNNYGKSKWGSHTSS
jgi:dTDP-4-dehydrorhamnose reductase